MRNLRFVLFALSFVIINQSCIKEPIVPQTDTPAPTLPDASTFIMNFSDFEDADTNKAFTNWFHAATNVVFWNTVITVNTIVPVAAFYKSFQHSAEFQGNATWLWEYSVPVNNDTYQAKLYGKILSADEVQWDMYISKNGGFSDFKWYSGIVKTDNTHAQWTLYKSAINPTEFIGIEYNKNLSNNLESIQFTNIIPGDAGNGGYIEYRTQSDDAYDQNYDIFRIEDDRHILINWSKTTKEGRVKDEVKFQDDEWHCWDEMLEDGKCP